MRTFYTMAVVLAMAATAAPAAAQSASPEQARLWDAAIEGDTAAIRAAVRAGADVNALDTRTSRNGRRALNWAAINNHPAAVTLLLSLGAEIDGTNITGFTALHHTAEFNAVDAARTLLAAGADPDTPNVAGNRPIDTALQLGNIGVAELLAQASED